MALFNLHPTEMMILYHPKSNSARQTLAYARSVARHVREVNYNKERLTPTMWRTLLKRMNLKPKEILDKSNPIYQEKFRGREYRYEDWLSVIIEHPQLIKAPIVVFRNKAMLCQTPTDVLKV